MLDDKTFWKKPTFFSFLRDGEIVILFFTFLLHLLYF